MSYRSVEIDNLHAKQYAQVRPKLDPRLVDLTVAYVNKHSGFISDAIVVDIGCGNGSSTEQFAPYFKKLYGVDPSAVLIDGIQGSSWNVQYKIGTAEEMPFESESIDVVLTSAPIHWFDIQKFLVECNRVLKPNGCLAIHGYFSEYIKPAAGDCKFINQPFCKFLNSCKFILDFNIPASHYRDVDPMILSDYKERHEFSTEQLTTLEEYKNHLTTISGYRRKYKEIVELCTATDGTVDVEAVKKSDPLELFSLDLKHSFGMGDIKDCDLKVIYRLDWFTILSTRPNNKN